MKVIGHEAVRKYRKPLLACGALNLLERDRDGIRMHEKRGPVDRAERQEIAVGTQVR